MLKKVHHCVISSFSDMLSVYQKYCSQGLENELNFFRKLIQSNNISDTKIAEALLSGSHQRYLNFKTAIKHRDNAKLKLAEAKLWDQQFKDFEELYASVCDVLRDIPYIKNLVKYDVAKRMAVMFQPEILPDKNVYIQNGAKIGAEKLLGRILNDESSIDRKIFIQFFGNLPAVHIENILCIMKDCLALKTVIEGSEKEFRFCDFDYDVIKSIDE